MTDVITTLMAAIIAGISTLFAAGLAVGGVLWTNARAERREDKRIAADRAWQRESWSRDQRRDAHLRFLEEQDRAQKLITDTLKNAAPPPEQMFDARWYVPADWWEEIPDDWWQSSYAGLLHVHVFASPAAAHAARQLYDATYRASSHAEYIGEADRLLANYHRVIQADLGIAEPAGTLYPPASIRVPKAGPPHRA